MDKNKVLKNILILRVEYFLKSMQIISKITKFEAKNSQQMLRFKDFNAVCCYFFRIQIIRIGVTRRYGTMLRSVTCYTTWRYFSKSSI